MSKIPNYPFNSEAQTSTCVMCDGRIGAINSVTNLVNAVAAPRPGVTWDEVLSVRAYGDTSRVRLEQEPKR